MSGQPPSRRETLDNVQALRGVAVLLVLLFHLHGLESGFVEGVRLLPDLCRAGRGGVDLFFVISGLVMVVSTRGRCGQPGEPRRFLLRRALRIYPVYWVYSLLTLSVYLLPAGS
ncbi:MAG: acyltransferase family protein, partial [Candidatus Latescibacterota bacterium]